MFNREKLNKINEYERVPLNFYPEIPNLKKILDKTKIDVRYPLIEPFAFAHIYWNPKIYELFYEIEEPLMNSEEIEIKNKIVRIMREIIDFEEVVEKNEDNLMKYIDERFKFLATELGMNIPYESYKKIYYYLCRDFIGFNELDPLLKDFFVEDIECNGTETPIYIVHRQFRNLKTNLVYKNYDVLEGFVEKLAQRCGKYISYSKPILDGSLPDGSRVNATYTKDITSRGPTFTIRKFTKIPWTPMHLISFGTLSPEMLAYLWLLIQYKMNILIVGGTSSGKTTFLNALAFFIPPEMRVVSIEDSVTGDSRIIIKEKGKIRNVTIKEFVDGKIDAEVMTLDEKGKIIFAKPSSYIKHKVKKDIYGITTKTGRKIKVTEDHSLFSLGENGLREVKPTELEEKKSFIAVPRILPIDGKNIKKINLLDYSDVFEKDFLIGKPVQKIFEKYSKDDFNVSKEKYRWWKKRNIIQINELAKVKFDFTEDELKKLKIKSHNRSSVPVIFGVSKNFLEFLGLWVGDGCYDNYNKNSVIISNQDIECRNVFLKLCDYLGSNYSIMNDKNVSMRIHNSVFYKFMKNVLKFDGYSDSKKIPDFIFNLSNEQIRHFIRGYFSADGTMKKNEVSCSSQSYTLLEDLQTLFLRQGIISRINDFDRKDKCINLSISSSENIEKFKEIGFLQDRKNNPLYSYNKKSPHTFSDVIPLSITQIKEIDKEHSKLSWPYLNGKQNIGRGYLQGIAIPNSKYNDLSHNDILWDKIRSIKKITEEETEVFDLSIPKFEKFLCNNIFVHNTREINLPRENWLPSVTRSATGLEEKEDIDLFTLLKSSFRQNPEYLIVGEVRGKEASVLFQGMASGHASISTMHADSVDTVIKRLQTPPIELSPALLDVLDCVCVMTHAIVNKQETRKLREIVEIQNVDDEGVANTNTPFVWNPSDNQFYSKTNSIIMNKISRRYGISQKEIGEEFQRRVNIIYRIYEEKIFDFREIQRIINEYYKKPKEILKKLGLE